MHGEIIAGMLFFLFFPLLPSSHSHPFLPFLSIISCSWLILTLCRAAHLLQVDYVEMHGKCTARYLGGVSHVRDISDKPYAGPAGKTFFKMDQSWCCSCVLVCFFFFFFFFFFFGFMFLLIVALVPLSVDCFF